jgi:hypothetical protein
LIVAAPLILAAAAAEAAGTPEQWKGSLYTGALSVLTRGESREYIAARLTASGPIAKGVSGFARADITGTQDGGGLDLKDPQTFRSVELMSGLRYPVGPFDAGAVAGVTYSIEGDQGKPIDPRLFTVAGLLRYTLRDGGYAYVGAGHHGPVGGPALLAAAAIPIPGKAGVNSIVDFAFPIARDALPEKRWVLRFGVSARVGSVGF